MNTLHFFAAIFLFIYPFGDLLILSRRITKLYQIAPNFNEYLKKIDVQNQRSLTNIINILSPKQVKDYLSNKKEYHNYKVSFYFFIWYFVNGFVAIAVNIMLLYRTFQDLSGNKFGICLVICVLNLCIIWILKLSGIFHFGGLNRLSDWGDSIAYSLLSPNGIINKFINKTLIKFILYFIDLLVFAVFYKCANNFISRYTDIDFFIVFAELIFFQYIFGKILACCVAKVHQSVARNKQKIKDYPTLSAYYFELCKSTTFLVLLSIYIINKYVQILSENSTHNLVLIEAIGALFLLDTYFEKNKIIDSFNLKENKQINRGTQNLLLEAPIMQIETTNEASSNEQPFTPQKNIDETAIPEYLEVVKSEYQIERNKKQSFETRSGLLLTLLGAMSIFYFQSVKLTDIIHLFSQPLTFMLLMKILAGCCMYGAFVFSYIAILKTISARRHDNFETNGINEKLLLEDRLNALTRIIFTYREIIAQHRLSNEKRAKWYISSLKSTLVLLLSTIIYTSL